jgi:uncharacterized protein (DUF1015 family)
MAEVRAFRGWRYDVSKIGALSQVVAPPYDVIGPELQHRLHEASPYNVIRLELGQDEPPGSTSQEDKYQRAGRLLREWRRSGILVEEASPALYAYHQVFQDPSGSERTRRGFLARVRLEPFGSGNIYPHEKTLSGPKADRLALYRATGCNISPVFGLYPDEAGKIQAVIETGLEGTPPLEAVDHLGVRHRLWPVTDSGIHTQVQGLLAELPVYIADGHHRYETGLKYRDELAAAGELSGHDDPANFTLMMLVGMSDTGLEIQPTHRLIKGFPGVTSEQLIERLNEAFDLSFEGEGHAGLMHAWEEIQLWGAQDMLGFGTVADGRWLTARLRDEAVMAQLVPDHSRAWRGLGVAILQKLVLEKLFADLGTPELEYVHRVDEVDQACASRRCDAACLVPAATMEDIRVIAGGGETMPPKSTYFYPKLATGFVLNPLRG